MDTVETSTGSVPASALGFTLMHEHVFSLNAEMRLQYPWDEEAMVARAVETLTDLRDLGVSTIVDLTVFGLGRDVPRIRRISRESGLQIVVATGIYTMRDMPTYFRNRHLADPGFLADFFVREIEDGIADTQIRPAILKCVTDRFGLTEDVEAILRATARAHRRTGVPVSTHSDSGTRQGLVQQRVFDEEGVDLTRVVIGHVGDSTDLDYIEELLAAGSTVGMDRFGDDQVTPAAARMDVVAELCRRGYASQIVLGHDTNVESDHTSTRMRARIPALRNWRYSYIPSTVVPGLRARGVSEADLHAMTVHNPRRILSRGLAY
ncbi:phosphotriesterase [Microbacterium ulmi]|uniref:Phosphotriesterase n=1 Tax=Microbacterium ulmi TaxID=179095 RepID=A0A7Y2Q057_9MICO|nr:phosphotriesterase [Microbacterium ulmi]